MGLDGPMARYRQSFENHVVHDMDVHGRGLLGLFWSHLVHLNVDY